MVRREYPRTGRAGSHRLTDPSLNKLFRRITLPVKAGQEHPQVTAPGALREPVETATALVTGPRVSVLT